MDEPSALSIAFLAPVEDQRTPELRLRYDVQFTDSEISNETLWKRRSKGYALVFERDYTTVTVEPELSKFDTNADKITNLAALMLEDNESFLSYSAGKLRIPPLVAAHGWFQDQLTIIGVDSLYPFLAARVAPDHVFESAMNKELSKIDTGIGCSWKVYRTKESAFQKRS